MRAFLEDRRDLLADLSDVSELEPDDAEGRGGLLSFCYAGVDSERTRVVEPQELRSGDLVVVPAAYGGCDKWGWKPGSSDPVIDVADEAAQPYAGRRYAVRLTGALIAQELADQGRDERHELERDWGSQLAAIFAREDDTTAIAAAVLDLSPPAAIRSQLAALEHARGRRGRSLRCLF